VTATRTALLLLLLLAAPACGDDSPTTTPDAVTDAVPVAGADVAPDATPARVPLVALSFNVLCSFCDPVAYDPWVERVPYFADILARHDPDLVGLQELTVPAEVDQILALWPGFDAVFFQAAGAFMDWPDATVLYRASRFELRDRGEFWLSPTPDVPGSIGFAAQQLARLVVWVRLYDRANDAEIVFATTHFDNNPPSQERSAPLLLERLGPLLAAYPTVVTGDFNSQPYDEAYRVLVEGVAGAGADAPRLVDAYDLAAAHDRVASADPPPPYDPSGRIDHVFVAGADWHCTRWAVDLSVYGPQDRFPSDHWPVLAACGW
jgi:endonuclease/exonuclease/phosphatase family metal-dependent hydrolase